MVFVKTNGREWKRAFQGGTTRLPDSSAATCHLAEKLWDNFNHNAQSCGKMDMVFVKTNGREWKRAFQGGTARLPDSSAATCRLAEKLWDNFKPNAQSCGKMDMLFVKTNGREWKRAFQGGTARLPDSSAATCRFALAKSNYIALIKNRGYII